MRRFRANSRPASAASAVRGALCGLLSLSVLATSSPALAAATAPAPAAEPDNSTTVGLMRLSGDPAVAADVRAYIQSEFEGADYTVRGIALDMDTAAQKVKCKSIDDTCLGKVAELLTKGKGKAAVQPYGYLVYGTAAPADAAAPTRVTIYDLNAKTTVKVFEAAFTSDDYILPISLPRAMVRAVVEAKAPPPPLTPEEELILAELDEGAAKTPEELRAEAQALADATKAVDDMPTDAIDTSGIEVDLKKDFEAFCRNEPRMKRESRDDPPDLRPACKRGDFFGYWQPRAWVALGLTAGGILATGTLYTMGLVVRGGAYSDAVDALNDAKDESMQPKPLSNTDPEHGAAYTNLAAEVAAQGNRMRSRFLGGDIALGATVLLAGVVAVIIYQDRTDAKRFIKTEKSLKAITRGKIQDLQVAPMIGAVQGAGLGFRF